jgi:hypothetical protein
LAKIRTKTTGRRRKKVAIKIGLTSPSRLLSRMGDLLSIFLRP